MSLYWVVGGLGYNSKSHEKTKHYLYFRIGQNVESEVDWVVRVSSSRTRLSNKPAHRDGEVSRISHHEPALRDGGSRALFIIEEQGESLSSGFYDHTLLT